MTAHIKLYCLHVLSVCVFRYYTFDDAFVREVLGKKLSKGTKKDLDDIGAKTGVTLKSCRRQVSAQCLCICINLYLFKNDECALSQESTTLNDFFNVLLYFDLQMLLFFYVLLDIMSSSK